MKARDKLIRVFAVVHFIVILSGGSGSANGQVSTNFNKRFSLGTSESFGMGHSLWKYQTNEAGHEFLDSDAVRAIAKACNLSDEEIASVQVVVRPGHEEFNLEQIGNSDKAYRLLLPPLEIYAKGRSEGHTKDFLLARITNRAAVSWKFDSNLLVLSMSQPGLRVDLMKKLDSGPYTNLAGRVSRRTIDVATVNGARQTNETVEIPKHDEICRWTSYVLVDGELAWVYRIGIKEKGNLDYVLVDRRDAKEFDPKYERIIKEVEREITVEMKKKGTYGLLGTIRSFWELEKAKLTDKGIEWRSPEELNPEANYD